MLDYLGIYTIYNVCTCKTTGITTCYGYGKKNILEQNNKLTTPFYCTVQYIGMWYVV